MEIRNVSGLKILQFKEIVTLHGFTTRPGGVSGGNFASLNFGRYSGDDPRNVDRNFEILFEALGLDSTRVAMTRQTHSTHLKRIDGPGDAGIHEGVDGLMTDVPGMVLLTFYADCTPLYFYDPRRRAVAVAHAGWQGTLAKIAAKTVAALGEEFGVDPGDLVAGIGPNLSRENFEVSPDFLGTPELEEAFSRYLSPRRDRFTFDLVASNRDQLRAAGLRKENIHLSHRCTYGEESLFYSYRRQGGASGRMAGFIGLGDAR